MRDGHDRMPTEVLARVRALLAKAASTEFAEEADALTEKAQELMARHRIEQAMLDEHGGCARDRSTSRRIPIRGPFAAAKATLLGDIAAANGCVAICSEEQAVTTVFGFETELRGVEALYASLAAQAAAAVETDDASGDSLVPALVRSEAEVRAAAAAAFPDTEPMPIPDGDGDGWRAGTAFGEAVHLGVGTELEA